MSNGHLRRCPECNGHLPENRTKFAKFCSTKCATRARVRRHRLKHSDEGTAHVKIRRAQLKRDIEKAQVTARTALRKGTAIKRRELRRLNRELTTTLARDITVSDTGIRSRFESQIGQEFDTETIALAIAVGDARTTN